MWICDDLTSKVEKLRAFFGVLVSQLHEIPQFSLGKLVSVMKACVCMPGVLSAFFLWAAPAMSWDCSV